MEQSAADAADIEQLVMQGVYPFALLLNVVTAALVVLVAVTLTIAVEAIVVVLAVKVDWARLLAVNGYADKSKKFGGGEHGEEERNNKFGEQERF